MWNGTVYKNADVINHCGPLIYLGTKMQYLGFAVILQTVQPI